MLKKHSALGVVVTDLKKLSMSRVTSQRADTHAISDKWSKQKKQKMDLTHFFLSNVAPFKLSKLFITAVN